MPIRRPARRPYAARWIDTIGPAVIAAFAIAMLELVFVAAMVPAAPSSALGLLFTWAQTFALFGGYAVIGASVIALPGRARVRRWLARSGEALLFASVVGAAALVPLGALATAIGDEPWEFPREMRAMHALLAAVVVAVVVAIAEGARRRFGARVSWRARRSAGAWLAGVGAVVGVASAHLLLAPENLVAPCGVVGLAALLLALLAALPALPRARSARDVAPASAVVLAALAYFVPGAPRDHARFLLWNHGALAAPLAEAVRAALDRDHDGAAPRALGGTDCAEGDPSRGPLVREIPGDGIDQDCRGGDAPVPASPPAARVPDRCERGASPPDVLLVTIDALRADRVTPETLPALFALARRGTTFTRAYAPTALTATSMTATLTARPYSDLVGNALTGTTLVAPFTVASLFAAAGYRTHVFNPFGMHDLLLHGFQGANDAWLDRPPAGPKQILSAGAIARGALDFMTEPSERPFFAWVHFGDAHARYKLDHDDAGRALSEVAAYDRGIAYVGQRLGELLAALEARGLLDRTVVAVTADHGEELLARGREGHGANVFEESTHVPLVLWAPGCAARVVETPVGLPQIGPTLGAIAGVRVPGWGLFDGRPLPVVSEATVGYRTQFKRAIVGERYKLIVDEANGGRMLFDLTADPGETTNLYGTDLAARDAMEAAYQRWLDAPGAR